jgi:hypothetical protein
MIVSLGFKGGLTRSTRSPAPTGSQGEDDNGHTGKKDDPALTRGFGEAACTQAIYQVVRVKLRLIWYAIFLPQEA